LGLGRAAFENVVNINFPGGQFLTLAAQRLQIGNERFGNKFFEFGVIFPGKFFFNLGNRLAGRQRSDNEEIGDARFFLGVVFDRFLSIGDRRRNLFGD
jgi:hypothetical protein